MNSLQAEAAIWLGRGGVNFLGNPLASGAPMTGRQRDAISPLSALQYASSARATGSFFLMRSKPSVRSLCA
jgi:hypothetical protein